MGNKMGADWRKIQLLFGFFDLFEKSMLQFKHLSKQRGTGYIRIVVTAPIVC